MNSSKPNEGWTEEEYHEFKLQCFTEYVISGGNFPLGNPIQALQTEEYNNYILEKYSAKN